VGLEAIDLVEGLCPPPEPFSYAIRAGNTLYLAGQVSVDADGNVVGETVNAQARQVWKNISSVLAAAGSSIGDVVKVTYYMQDIREIEEEIQVRKEVFAGRPYPAVTAIQAAALGLSGLKMEVDVIAVTAHG
jgi:2-iminobutanoate/2-iminopropanoate deaminase